MILAALVGCAADSWVRDPEWASPTWAMDGAGEATDTWVGGAWVAGWVGGWVGDAWVASSWVALMSRQSGVR